MEIIFKVLNLLEKYGNEVMMTAPEASHNILLAKIYHGYTGENVFNPMEGHDSLFHLCEYALRNYTKLHGMVPHRDSYISPR